MKRLGWFLVVLLAVVPGWAAKTRKMTVDQLKQMLVSAHQANTRDPDLAKELEDVELTEELTHSALESLGPDVPGQLTTEQLFILEAKSAALPPPASDIPTAAGAGRRSAEGDPGQGDGLRHQDLRADAGGDRDQGHAALPGRRGYAERSLRRTQRGDLRPDHYADSLHHRGGGAGDVPQWSGAGAARGQGPVGRKRNDRHAGPAARSGHGAG